MRGSVQHFGLGMITGLLFRRGKGGKVVLVLAALALVKAWVWWSELPAAVRFLTALGALIGVVLLLDRRARARRRPRRQVPVRRAAGPREPVDGITFLYRWWDADGTLLYVGISNNLERRAGEHADDKPWMHPGVTCTVETFPTRDEALAAEQRAIWREAPRHNVVHNGGRHR